MKSCTLCLSNQSQMIIENPIDLEYFKQRSVKASIYRCSCCHSLEQYPALTIPETQKLYDENYQNYNKSSSFLIRSLFSYLAHRTARQFLQNFPKDSSILDYGCGYGNFLISLRDAGATNLFGFDYTPVPPTPGIHFFSSLEQISKAGQRFDVIRMNHVIEHLVDLDATMIQLSGLLKPGGLLIGQKPNPDALSFYIFKSRWGALHFPYHTYLFTPQGLQEAARRWNLKDVHTSRSIMPTGWSMSFENVFKQVFNLRTIGRTKLYPLFLLLSIPFVALEFLLSPQGHRCSIIDFNGKAS